MMIRTSSFAPHLGAALGAGLMLAASLAFNAGAGAGGRESATPAAAAQSADARSVSTTPQPESFERAIENTAESVFEPSVSGRDVAPSETRKRPDSVIDTRPRLAVILDDVAEPEAALRALELGFPVTLSILPYAEHAPRIAALAAGEGREYFLHLPMEPVGLDDPGPHALTTALDDTALAARLAFAFARVPGAAGFNNHMGSRMTADRGTMDRVFAALGEDRAQLLFVDSLTHPRSTAGAAARAAGFASLARDVFLDHERDPAIINAQLDAALSLAREQGAAIMIAHPRPETFDVLETLAERADEAGVQLVTVGEVAAQAN